MPASSSGSPRVGTPIGSPGDAGLAPSIDWTGSGNLAAAEIAWPAPTRFSVEGLETQGYVDRVVLPIEVTLAKPGAPLRLHAEVSYAACADICVPYRATLDLGLPAGLAVAGPEASRIAEARTHVPTGMARAGLVLVAATVSDAMDGVDLSVQLEADPPLEAPDLFVEGLAAPVSPGRPRVATIGRTTVLTVPLRGARAATIAGLPLTLTSTDGAGRAAEFPAIPTLGPAPSAPGR
jgi:suppressor for copper-sensitivity B